MPPPAAPPIAQRPELPPEALAMVRNMFKGAKIDVAVEVDGAIVTTDGPKRDGSRVTIFGLDFEQLLSDPAKFTALQGMKPGADFTTARKSLEGVPGVILPDDADRHHRVPLSPTGRGGADVRASGASRPPRSRPPMSPRRGCRTSPARRRSGTGAAPTLWITVLKRLPAASGNRLPIAMLVRLSRGSVTSRVAPAPFSKYSDTRATPAVAAVLATRT